MEELLKVANAEGIKGTVIGEILEILVKKDFIPVSNKMESGEELIPDGDMTDLEKAVYSLSKKASQSMRHPMELFRDLGHNMQSIENLKSFLGNFKKEAKKMAEAVERSERLMNLMWMLIRDRLENGHGYASIGIRDGFKVVNIIEESESADSCGCPKCQMKKEFEKIKGAKGMDFAFPVFDGKEHSA